MYESVLCIQAWVGSPAIYVFDCSAAGLIINSFRAFAEQRAQVRRLLHRLACLLFNGKVERFIF